jgi:hypothetical protein
MEREREDCCDLEARAEALVKNALLDWLRGRGTTGEFAARYSRGPVSDFEWL